ncbi:MAG: polysaccharide pyruvyl transferase family protein [Phycisphaerales bacterium]
MTKVDQESMMREDTDRWKAAIGGAGAGGRGVRVVLAGAAPDTGNLGVSALAYSCIEGLLSRLPGCELTVLDFGKGVRKARSIDGIEYTLVGAKHSRRLYQQETMWQIRLAAKLGGLNNPAARRVLAADAVLDISGGDSFADLYGSRRFAAVAATKELALDHGVPLILLPQTYGPFHSAEVRRRAERIVRGCEMAWARDERSFVTLKDLAGAAFDAGKHLCGVDVAFGLRGEEPGGRLVGRVREWVEGRSCALPGEEGLTGSGPEACEDAAPLATVVRPDGRHAAERLLGAFRGLQPRGTELVGVNVSGLLYNDAAGAREQYGLKADYREVVTRFVRRMVEESGANVMLMPHVVTPSGHYESDVDACEAVKAAVVRAAGEGVRERMEVAPALTLPGEAKWVISRCDWFCGTRMHATIAGLSSGVPTAAVAYSIKTQGVFESCGQGEHVADPRTLETDAVVERLWKSWEGREAARESLRRELPRTVGAAEKQMDSIAAKCAELSGKRKALRNGR